MTELLSAGEMRAVEQAAIGAGFVTGLELMERAGRGVVEAVFEEWPHLAAISGRVLVLCGPGNNGGDGFVVARLLREWGWEVEVSLFGDAAKLPPDARVNYERWVAQGTVGDWADIGDAQGADLVVDALFGTGLTRPVAAEVVAPILGQPGALVVAVDIASGLDADSGRVIGAAAVADLTVTFHRAKTGHYLAEGPAYSGRMRRCDIGLSEATPEAVRMTRPKGLAKSGRAHKYGYGHALVLSGGFGRTGAARLAARGALRIGAGLVTLGVPGSAQMEVASQITALMLRRVEDADELAQALEDKRINALCLGPGMGVGARTRAMVAVAVRAEHAPYVVLDADALGAYSEGPEALFEMLHAGCVITPHGGEFARLFPDLAARQTDPAYSKVDAARDAAARAGCIVLYKGADTVIAAPGGRCAINSAHYERSAPWLATAGSGDVLAGFITGLLARGLDPMAAAETAAWLHVECARSFGPGLIAEDLAEELAKVLRTLG